MEMRRRPHQRISSGKRRVLERKGTLKTQVKKAAASPVKKATSPSKAIAKSDIAKAQKSRKAARKALRKVGRPIPPSLRKGTLKKAAAKAASSGKKAASASPVKKASSPSSGKDAVLKRAHKLRSKARSALRKDGQPIPKDLEKRCQIPIDFDLGVHCRRG